MMSHKNKAKLLWVLGPSETEGNERAGALAKEGSAQA